MEQFKGTISQDGKIVADNVEVHFEINQVGKLQVNGYLITRLGWQTLQPNS